MKDLLDAWERMCEAGFDALAELEEDRQLELPDYSPALPSFDELLALLVEVREGLREAISEAAVEA